MDLGKTIRQNYKRNFDIQLIGCNIDKSNSKHHRTYVYANTNRAP